MEQNKLTEMLDDIQLAIIAYAREFVKIQTSLQEMRKLVIIESFPELEMEIQFSVFKMGIAWNSVISLYEKMRLHAEPYTDPEENQNEDKPTGKSLAKVVEEMASYLDAEGIWVDKVLGS